MNMNFNIRLKALLTESGHTQKELADYIGVKPNTVCDWVNKSTSPKVEHIYKMVEFFNVTFDYLFTGETEPARDLLSDDESEVLLYFNKLPREQQYRQIGKLQGLVEEYEERESNSAEKKVI